MTEKENTGWDLKFQNFWGYTVAADRDLEKSQAMCEKFFTHIGLFRAEAASKFKEIIDELHKPNIE